MLKKISKLFLGLVVCAGSACVTPTHASSAPPVLLTHIQAAGVSGAKEEMVAIYNNTATPVDITGWCLKNKAKALFFCFTPPHESSAYFIPGYSYGVVVSEQVVVPETTPLAEKPLVYNVTNQTSGSIIAGKDTISLLDKNEAVVDSYSWSSPIASGKMALRSKPIDTQQSYPALDPLTGWSQAVITLPAHQVYLVEKDDSGPPISLNEAKDPYITELMPNPKGSDGGAEFIELFNPNQTAVSLDEYSFKVGPALEKTYRFPEGASISPRVFKAFYNLDIRFTLLNSKSSVQLLKNGQPIGEVVTYNDVAEGFSYAMVDESSFAVTEPTPNAQNALPLDPAFDDTEESEADDTGRKKETAIKPCAANQYRHPETNRCRQLGASPGVTQAPCAPNQYRSLETKRCRNNSTKTTQAACKEGQSRNPETNRCRAVAKMTNAGHSAKQIDVKEKSEGVTWYWWAGIAGVVVLIVSYAVWEWRVELMGLLNKIRAKFAHFKK